MKTGLNLNVVFIYFDLGSCKTVYLLGLREKVEHICYRGYTEIKGWRGRETVEKRDKEGANLV